MKSRRQGGLWRSNAAHSLKPEIKRFSPLAACAATSSHNKLSNQSRSTASLFTEVFFLRFCCRGVLFPAFWHMIGKFIVDHR